MEVQVESEANQYIPFSLDEVSLDFCVIGPIASSPGDVDVLIAASRKEKVQDRQGLAEAAGLKPMVIDIESYAARLAATPSDDRVCPKPGVTPSWRCSRWGPRPPACRSSQRRECSTSAIRPLAAHSLPS